MLDEEFLNCLRCLHTGSSLSIATPDQRSQFNAAVRAGKSFRPQGELVSESLEGPDDGLLINQEGTWAYPIRNGIVVLLAKEAMSCDAITMEGRP